MEFITKWGYFRFDKHWYENLDLDFDSKPHKNMNEFFNVAYAVLWR